MSRTQRMTTITMLTAVSILFHMIESMIPVPVPVPGFKLGLANIVGLIAYYLFDARVMLSVNIMRVTGLFVERDAVWHRLLAVDVRRTAVDTGLYPCQKNTDEYLWCQCCGKQRPCDRTGHCGNADLPAVLHAGNPAGTDIAGHPDRTVCGTCRKSGSETNTHRMIAVD